MAISHRVSRMAEGLNLTRILMRSIILLALLGGGVMFAQSPPGATCNAAALGKVAQTVNTGTFAGTGSSWICTQTGAATYAWVLSGNYQLAPTNVPILVAQTSPAGNSCVYAGNAAPIYQYNGNLYQCGSLNVYVQTTNTGGGSVSVTSANGGIAVSPSPGTGTFTVDLANLSSTTHQWIDSVVSGVFHASQPAFTDISGVATGAQLPNPSATTLGGVESAAAVSHQWINSISTSGVPALSQPASTDLSDAANVALLNASNTFTATANQFNQVTSLGTTSTDSGNLGSELTSSGTTTSTGWTGTYNSYTNGASNTTALTYAPTISNGSHYQVVITVSGYSAGSISITFGGMTLSGMSSNTTQTAGPKTTSTAGLVITPTSTFVGTVTASIKLISAISTYSFANKDSTGAYSLIALQPLASLHNVFIGGGGLYNTTGNSNTAFGYQALLNNTTGGNNSAVGYQALQSNTTGSNNSAFGHQALINNTTGGNNSAVGYQALINNTTGGNNSAVGYQALLNNTTGSNNSAFGHQALINNTTGGNNSAVGYQALINNTTGGYNSAVGYQALLNNTTGSTNSSFGSGALLSNTGSSNSAVGYQALQSNTTGSNNSSFGFQAGYGTSSTNANTSGGNNTFIGYEAAPGSSTQQNYLTVIGASATATCSSCVSLGRSGSDSIQNGGATWQISSGGNEKVQSVTGISSAPSVAITGTGTCTLAAPTGSNISGLISATAACTNATITLTWSGSFAYPTHSLCSAMQDRTQNTTFVQTNDTTTTAVFTAPAIVASDVLQYGACTGY